MSLVILNSLSTGVASLIFCTKYFWRQFGHTSILFFISTLRAIQQGGFDFEQELNTPICPPDCGDGGGGGGTTPLCIWIPENTAFQTEVSVEVPTKNDGLIQPPLALWTSGDSWTPNNPHLYA